MAKYMGMKAADFELALAALERSSGLTGQMIQARERAGLTQAQLAERMGTKQPAIARLEAGRVSPTVETLRKLAEVTGSRLVLRLDAPLV